MKNENARGAAKNPNCGTGPSRDPHCGIFSTPKVFRVRVNAVDSYCLKALDSLSFRFSMEQKAVQGGKGTLLHTARLQYFPGLG